MGYSDPTPICGIYRITCTVTGRAYVGSTASMRDRWRYHCSDLDSGRHRNRFMLSAWRKYGRTAFKFEVLQECVEARLIALEGEWVGRLGTTAPAGFNFGDPALARAQAAKQYVLTDPSGREHVVTNLHRWCRENGMPNGSGPMTFVAQAKTPSHRGWLCRYAWESAKAHRGRINAMLRERRDRRMLYKDGYTVTAPNGDRFDVDAAQCFAHWCRDHGLDHGAMIRTADGKQQAHFGYRAERKVLREAV